MGSRRPRRYQPDPSGNIPLFLHIGGREMATGWCILMKFQQGLYVNKNWSVRGFVLSRCPDFVIKLAQFEGGGKWVDGILEGTICRYQSV